MKKIPLRFLIAFLTFFIGISFSVIFILKPDLPKVPIPESQKLYDKNFINNSPLTKTEKKAWETQLLPIFKELPLENLSQSADETYRFVLLPTFDAPIIVRVWRSGDEYFMVTKKTNGQGGFGLENFGKLSYEKKQKLTEEEWKTFIQLLDRAMFWDMPFRDKDELPVTDGASWTMEGFGNNVYHEVDRITPHDEFKESCLYLLRLSGFEANYEEY